MNIPKWLFVVVAVVAAAAVGVAAVLIGMRFTPPVVPVLTTEQAPVLAPAEPQEGDTPYDSSPPVGEQQIVTPGQDGVDPIDSAAQTQIDDLNAAGGESAPGVGSEPPSEDPAPAGDDAPLDSDDPCATATPPDGCPVGVTGIVLADTRLPAIPRLYLHPDPGTDVGATSFHCPGTSTPGSVWIDVGTEVPVDLTLTYSPVGDPSDEHTATVSTSTADRHAWDADFAAHHVYREHYWFFQNCVQLTGLTSGEYSITVTGTDIFGRVPDPVTGTFDGRGQPVEPPMSVIPLNGALVYVSVLSPFGVDHERPAIRAWVAGPGDPTDCSDIGRSAELTSLQGHQTYPVEQSWLHDRNYRPEYTSRDVVIYSVPEGSQVVVCARWYRTTNHSWESNVSAQKRLLLSSPDTVTPTVSIESLDLGRQIQPGDLRITASMPGGVGCGEWVNDAVLEPGSVDVGAGICDTRRLGFDGRVVVTTGVNLGDDHWAETSSVLQLVRHRCTGDCPVYESSHYLVDLATITHGTGLCSGDGCTPPSATSSAGRAVLSITWDQGSVNHATDWRVGAEDSTVPGGTTSAAPQLDTSNVAEWSHSADGWTGIIRVPVEVDRDAHYRATLSGSCFPDGYTDTVKTGRATPAGPVPLTWVGLCPEGNYFITIELWDDAGHRQVYSYDRTDAGRWVGGFVPLTAVIMNASVLAYAGPQNASFHAYGISYIEVNINGYTINAGVAADNHCQAASSSGLHPATGDGIVPQARTYTVTVTAHVFNQDPAFSPTGGPADQCGFEEVSYGEATFSGTFTQQQFLDGVRLTGNAVWSPDSHTASNFGDWNGAITLTGVSGH